MNNEVVSGNINKKPDEVTMKRCMQDVCKTPNSRKLRKWSRIVTNII